MKIFYGLLLFVTLLTSSSSAQDLALDTTSWTPAGATSTVPAPPPVQLRQPALNVEPPNKVHPWFIAMFSVGAAMIPIGGVAYLAADFCDRPDGCGDNTNRLWVIPLVGLGLFVAGLSAFIISKARYGEALAEYQRSIQPTAW